MSSSNRQLSINMIATITSFVIMNAINLVLTPYVVENLGAAAYGFVGLGNQIIGYSSLITIALNSMAGRFITIEYHKGNIEKANKYYSSVFYSNCIISLVLLLLTCGLVLYLEYVINIPNELVQDVKLLFLFLSINSIIALITNVYSTSCFIKNRLDFTNIRNATGNILRAVVLLILFTLLSPKVWYFGFTGLITTLYVAYTNYRFSKKLTPELKISRLSFNIAYIKELLTAGVWNLITKLSQIFESGLNLLIANLFVGARLGGIYTLGSTVPLLVNQVCSLLSANFAPSWTQLYASGDKSTILKEIHKSLRIMGAISSILMSIFIVYGKLFYSLWVPTEDSSLLYKLAIVSSFVMVVAMPLEPLWQIFTITDKVKKSSINLMEWSILMLFIVFVGMYITDDLITRLFILASVKSIIASLRTLTFLPIYGAKCMGFDKFVFYPHILKNILCLGLIVLLGCPISLVLPNSWYGLIVGSIVTGVLGCLCNYILILTREERVLLISKIRRIQ